MKLKHFGYFNEIEDLHYYSKLSADDTIINMNNNIGNFHSVEDFGLIDKEDIVFGEFKITSNEQYAIVSDLPIDMSLLGKPYVCDFFIDIYEIIEK